MTPMTISLFLHTQLSVCVQCGVCGLTVLVRVVSAGEPGPGRVLI